MTHIKSKLMTTAIILACTATPAFADHHAEGDMKTTMEKTETMMKDGDTMMKDGEAMMEKGDHMMKDGDHAMKKGDHMMKDGDHMMKSGDAMMKTDTMMKSTTVMTAAERIDAEKKIINSMSKKDRKAFMKLAPKQRKMMMDSHLRGGDYRVGTDTMMGDKKMPATDQVIAMDAQETGSMMTTTTTAPMPAQTITTVACPVGTTAQPNGTCMITGDYKY